MGFLSGTRFSAMLLLVGLCSQSVRVAAGKMCESLQVTVMFLCVLRKQVNNLKFIVRLVLLKACNVTCDQICVVLLCFCQMESICAQDL